MKYYKKIEGDKIYLSPMSIEDAETYALWMNDPEITDGIGTSTKIVSLDWERDWIAQNAGLFQFAVIEKETDTLLGNCSLQEVNSIRRVGEIGVFIGDKENRHKGYGTEAILLTLEYGFKSLNLNNIMLRVFDFNSNALECYEKIGFRKIGERREAYYVNGAYHNEIYMDFLKREFLEKYPDKLKKR